MEAEEGFTTPRRSGELVTTALERGEHYDPRPVREFVRSSLAIGLLVLFAVVLLSLVGYVIYSPAHVKAVKEIGALALTPLIGLAGTALGFYFGGHHPGQS